MKSCSCFLKPVTVYFVDRDTPKAYIFVPSATDNASLIVTLSGYLVQKT